MTNLLDDLAPCPFCGGGAEVRIPTESDGFALHISCRCGAQLWGHKRHFQDAEEAISSWNTRTHAAEIERNARDAEMYRWLRDVAWSLPAVSQQELPAVAVFSGSGRRCKDISGEEMDRAIDDAMKLELTHG